MKDGNEACGGTFPVERLEEGDILLMMGDSPLSEVIAWASDGIYSHAAVVADGGDLIEASLAGVRRAPLARRMLEVEHFHFIDAFRVRGPRGSAVAADDRGLVRAHAQGLLGVPYPVDQLALLGVVMAVRGKWPVHPVARWLVRQAFDRALPADATAMVCSEVVYRAWAECDARPAGRLAPAIVPGERGSAPLPDVDWQALLADVFGRPAQGADALRAAPGMAFGRAAGADAGEISDEALEAARARVLAGMQGGGLLQADGAGALRSAPAAPAFAPKTNPRLVSPQDLANSPGVERLGRLMARAPAAPAQGARRDLEPAGA